MDYTDALRRMVMMDADYVGALLRSGDTELIERADAKVLSLARVAALAGSRATAHSYSVVVADAIGAGATPDEIVDVLAGIAPIIGSAALAVAAPALALALGYDAEYALE